MVIVFMLLVLFGTIILSVPVFGAMGLSTLVHWMDEGRESVLLIFNQQTMSGLTGFTFLAVPMFLLTGELMSRGGITDRLIGLARAFVGHFTGGLAQVNVLSSAFFATISGSGQADVAAMGSVFIPAMKKEGYPAGLAGAITASSATLSPVIPPGVIMIVYGALFGVPIAAMFAAGLTVGILLAALYMTVTYFVCRKLGIPKYDRATLRQIISAFKTALLPLGLPILILGGIVGGIVTATEASAIAVAYSLFLTIVVYKTVNLRSLYEALRDAAITSAGILIVAGVAISFSYVVARRNIPQIVARGLLSVTDNPFLIIVLIFLALFIAGMFIGRTANVLMFGPILVPVMVGTLGYSPVQTGFILITVLGIGHMTPPVGGTLLTTALVGKVDVLDITRNIWPFIIVDSAVTFMIILIPAITETLPRLLNLGGLG
ncbi:MAG: TRAP transporter large permease [Alkalispirochaeta sp.]